MTHLAISLCLLLASFTASAQSFPSKPIRVVIPFVAGGSSHLLGPPVGHTSLIGSIGVFSINSALFKDLRYNPQRDFAPITLAVTTPKVLITKPALAANSMKELVDYAKKNPGKLSYCSSGTGSSDHLTAELLNQVAGISAVHVPYKGGAACQTDIMGGQVDMSFQNLGAVTNYIRGNRMKALAVTAKARHPPLPNVPTTAEGGVPGLRGAA